LSNPGADRSWQPPGPLGQLAGRPAPLPVTRPSLPPPSCSQTLFTLFSTSKPSRSPFSLASPPLPPSNTPYFLLPPPPSPPLPPSRTTPPLRPSPWPAAPCSLPPSCRPPSASSPALRRSRSGHGTLPTLNLNQSGQLTVDCGPYTPPSGYYSEEHGHLPLLRPELHEEQATDEPRLPDASIRQVIGLAPPSTVLIYPKSIV
jgi:hypothetical protein